MPQEPIAALIHLEPDDLGTLDNALIWHGPCRARHDCLRRYLQRLPITERTDFERA